MGLGLVGGGVGVVKWLAKQGAKIIVTDLKTKKELAPSLKKLKNLQSQIKYILGRHRKIDFQKADLIIKNPGVANDSPYLKIAQSHKVPIETDMSLFFKYWTNQIVGVTGTKGKSTTTSLIYEILKSAGLPVKVAGNIGQTPLKFLTSKQDKNEIMILELSSFQLENLKNSPSIAVITNIYHDHLNRYKKMRKYIAAKSIIFKYQKSEDFVILNYDNPILRKMEKKIRSQIIWFSRKDIPLIRTNSRLVVFSKKNKIFLKTKRQKKEICSLENIKLVGQHNLENILAAVAVACLYKIKPKIIQTVLRSFKGITNRLELVRTVNGVKYYNDTAATMPEATIAALTSLASLKIQNLHRKRIRSWRRKSNIKNIILIAGGSDKKLKFNNLIKVIRQTCKSVILLPGTATEKLKLELANNLHDRKFQHLIKGQLLTVKNMKEAVRQAESLAEKGDIVLLSPACASFGLFKNEFDRGQQFKKWVRAINY